MGRAGSNLEALPLPLLVHLALLALTLFSLPPFLLLDHHPFHVEHDFQDKAFANSCSDAKIGIWLPRFD